MADVTLTAHTERTGAVSGSEASGLRLSIYRLRRRYRAEVEALVREGFADVAGLSNARVWVIGDLDGIAYTGEAWWEGAPPFTKGATRYYAAINLPADLDAYGAFPQVWKYTRPDGTVLRSAPEIEVRCWQEMVFTLAAHEACHWRQFRAWTASSEVEADRYAKRKLRAWRAGR